MLGGVLHLPSAVAAITKHLASCCSSMACAPHLAAGAGSLQPNWLCCVACVCCNSWRHFVVVHRNYHCAARRSQPAGQHRPKLTRVATKCSKQMKAKEWRQTKPALLKTPPSTGATLPERPLPQQSPLHKQGSLLKHSYSSKGACTVAHLALPCGSRMQVSMALTC